LCEIAVCVILCCAEFRIGRATILVATDVAARGLGKKYFYVVIVYPV